MVETERTESDGDRPVWQMPHLHEDGYGLFIVVEANIGAGKTEFVGILSRIRGHLQSAVSYAGASTLRDAHLRVAREPERFLIPLSGASRRESFVR